MDEAGVRTFTVSISIFKYGKQKGAASITVDANFYLDPETKGDSLYMQQGQQGCIRPMVLEKAWAVYLSDTTGTECSYESIDADQQMEKTNVVRRTPAY